MKISFKLVVLFIFLIIFINIAIQESYIYYKSKNIEIEDTLNEKLRYEIFTKDMEERLLKYMSGHWSSSTGSQIYINLTIPPNQLTIDNETFDIIAIDRVDSIFGIVRFTVRDSKYHTFNQRFQLNKVFDTIGLIVMIFDPETKTCKDTKKIDPVAPICAKALYLHQEDDK